MSDPYITIAKRVGFLGQFTSETRSEIAYLAKQVRMEDQIATAPVAVANEISRYLDDIARNP